MKFSIFDQENQKSEMESTQKLNEKTLTDTLKMVVGGTPSFGVKVKDVEQFMNNNRKNQE